MKFVLLINLKLLTNANSFLLNIAEHEKSDGNEYTVSFFTENKAWQFIHSLYKGDNLNEMRNNKEIDFLKFCLSWGFTAQSTQWGHVERGQFT